MKKFYLLIAVLSLSFLSFSQSQTPEEIIAQLKGSSSELLGKKFVVAFPMNEVETHPTQALDVYIATSEDTQIRIYNNLTGFDEVLNVAAGEIGVLSTAGAAGGQLNWGYEVREVDQAVAKGFTIESEHPVSVYVMNSKSVSTEGYYAIPVKNWGKEYFHCSYYDFDEAREWAGGFVVVAGEDDTEVEIQLNGVGEFIPAANGRSIGDTIKLKLDEGEVYMLTGTGTTRGQFDLSGTKIIGDKNIGVISFHQRTMIPATVVNNGRDHLSEMILPVKDWGKSYATIEIDKGTNKGDFFRVMASEPNTNFSVRWYDKTTGEPIGVWDGLLEKPGDFAEYHPNAASACGNSTNSFESIRGISVFEADKPIQVMQYSYSACWDNAGGNYDPFMVALQPIEKFVKSTIFQTPSNKSGNEYVDNFLNLIIKGDPDDPQRNAELLNSVKFDGVPITTIDPDILENEIVDGLYWATIFPEIGPHTVEGDTEFGGYVYGFANFDSYGWSAALGAPNPPTSQDTLKPELTEISSANGLFQFSTSDTTNFPIPDNCEECLPQVDSKFFNRPYILNQENFSLNIDNELDFTGGLDKFDFSFEVEDLTQNASVEFFVFDDAGNYTLKTIDFQGLDDSDLNPDPISNVSGTDNLGRKFLVAFPPNDNESASGDFNIYINSIEKTDLKYYTIDNSINESIQIDENSMQILSTFDGFFDDAIEISKANIKENKAIILESTKPISVYVSSSKSKSMDGYWALPIKNWGNEYLHNSFYDFYEAKKWRSGFVIIGAEADTEIEIELNGVGDGTTVGKRKIGDTFSINLSEGETYLVAGNAETRGIFDLSGTKISGNKSFGVISFHERTMIPSTVVLNGRSFISEMLLPTQAWGTEFYSLEYPRETKKGDFYRIMAAEDNTQFKVRWYDLENDNLLGIWQGEIEAKGDFVEYHPESGSECGTFDNPYSSISGLSVFETSKPASVYKYSYSSCWDSTSRYFEPTMSHLTPVEQYSNKLVFNTASLRGLPNSARVFINLFLFNPDNAILTDKNIFSYNSNMFPFYDELRNNKFNEINYIQFSPTLKRNIFESDMPFSGEVFGYSIDHNYAWNLGHNALDLTIIDSIPPAIELLDLGNGRFEIIANEKVNQDKPENCEDCKPQIDSRFYRDIEIINNKNFTIELNSDKIENNWYLNLEGTDELSYIASVVDLDFNAELVFRLTDDRGNFAQDTISYQGLKSVDNKIVLQDNLVELFPNPVKNNLIINSEKSLKIKNIIINSANGEKILEINNTMLPKEINVSDLAAGVYFISINIENRNYNLKFIKN